MKSNAYFTIFISILLIFTLGVATAVADGITPYADSEFGTVTTVLKSSKQVSFRCVTYSTKKCISVTSCWLEIKNSDGSWSYVCSLTPPATVLTNTFAYSATVDYSEYIGNGTYRVWATYDADDHSVTRCSNERTY